MRQILYSAFMLLFWFLVNNVTMINAQEDLVFRGDYSNNSFNAESKFSNNFYRKIGKENISNYDGSLILEYGISTPTDREIPITKTLTYNANVHHSIFNYATSFDEENHVEGIDIVSPEWIWGINGFATEVDHPEQRMNMLNQTGQLTYNVNQSSYLPLVGEQTPTLIPGYHFTAKIRNSVNEYSFINEQHDFIRLLRSDGSLLTLINVEPQTNYGYYVQASPDANDVGYVIDENGQRVLYYKPGDGLTYKFIENTITYKTIRTLTQAVSDIVLRKMSFTKIISTTGMEVDVLTYNNFYGQTIETETESSFIEPTSDYDNYLPSERSDDRNISRSRMKSKVTIKGAQGEVVLEDTFTYEIAFREYNYGSDHLNSEYFYCEIPSYLLSSITSLNGGKTEYIYYDKDGFSQLGPSSLDVSHSWKSNSWNTNAAYRDCMTRFMIKDVKKYELNSSSQWLLKEEENYEYNFVPDTYCPDSYNHLATVPNITTKITSTSYNSIYPISFYEVYNYTNYKIWLDYRFHLSDGTTSQGLKESKVLKLIKYKKWENSNLVLEEEFDYGVSNPNVMGCSTTVLSLIDHDGESPTSTSLLSIYPLSKNLINYDKEINETTNYVYNDEAISTGANSLLKIVNQKKTLHPNGIINTIDYETDFFDPCSNNVGVAYNLTLPAIVKNESSDNSIVSLTEYDYYSTSPQGAGKLEEKRVKDPLDLNRYIQTNFEYVTSNDYLYSNKIGLYVGKIKKITSDNGLKIEVFYPAPINDPLVSDVKFFTKTGNELIVDEPILTTFYEDNDVEQNLLPRIVTTSFGTELRFKNQNAYEYIDVNSSKKGYLLIDENNFIKIIETDAFNRIINKYLPGTFEEFNPSYQNVDWDLSLNIVPPINPSSNYIYDYSNRKISNTTDIDPGDPNSNKITTENYFNVFGNLIEEKRNELLINTSEYDILGNKRKTTNAVGVFEEFDYYLDGDVRKNIHADYSDIENAYDVSTLSFGGTVSIRAKETTDEKNNKQYEFYDEKGNLIATNDEFTENNATVFKYNSLNQLIETISPEGKSILYQYDGFGNIIVKTTPDEGTHNYKYDKWGNLRFTHHTTSSPLKTTFYSYDPLNRILRIGETSSSFTSLSADVFDSNIENDATSLVINLYDNYTPNTVFPTLGPTIISQNTKGRLVASAFRDVTAAASANWSYKVYSYDHLGNINKFYVKLDGEDWKTIENEYDHAGKLISQNIAGDHYIWNEYDVNGRLALVKSNNSNNYATAQLEASYSYNAVDQIKIVGTEGYENILDDLTVNDIQNHQAPLVVANDVTVTSSGNLTLKGGAGITLNPGFSVLLGGEFNAIIDVTVGKGFAFGSTNYEYNNRGFVNEINNNSNAIFERFKETLTYEPNGNILSQAIINKGNAGWENLSFTYSYDNTNRLLNTGANPSTYYESFTYDNDGNFLTKNRTGKNLSFQYLASTNKINTITGTMNYTYGHDVKGNITLKKNTGGSDIYTATAYDHRNLPLTVNGSTTYKYDDSGNRVVKNTSTKNQHYLRDHTGREVAIYNLSTNAIEQVNIFGNGMVGYVEKGASDKRYYYVKDHLGSIRLVIDEDGDISSARDYYAYGDILREYVVGNEEKYKFTEKEHDSETGLDYFGARYFDSEVGRWTSVDPLADKFPGLSTYNYVTNNPLRIIDPNGMDTLYFDNQGKYLADQTRYGDGDHVGYYTDADGNSVQFGFNDQSDVAGFYKRDNPFTGIDLNFSNEIPDLLNRSGVENVDGMLSAYAYALTESPGGGNMDFMTYNAVAGNKLRLKLVGNTGYNSNDAGNYVWGVAMRTLGIPYKHAAQGAHIFELTRLNWGDHPSDQRAIFRGYFGF